MIVKITNCTVTTGGGPVPRRIRTRQNVRLNLWHSFFNGIKPKDYLNSIRYREHGLSRAAGRDFIVTKESKITIL